MNELKLSEYLINRFAIFNKDKPPKSEVQLIEMAEALESRGEDYRLAIKQAAIVIKQWHGDEAFGIYYDRAPEMELIRKSIGQYIEFDKLRSNE